MVKLLVVLATLFLFLSSSVADVLGLQGLRTLLFIGVVMGLLALAFARHPGIDPVDGRMALLLVWLLSLTALVDLDGRIDVFDFKVLLPILVLLAGPAVARGLGRTDPARLFYGLLAAYVLVSWLLLMTGAASLAVRGYGRFLRYDVTGSLVAHASLCTIGVLLAVAAFRRGGHVLARLAQVAVLSAAASMLLLAATRTVLVTFTLYAVLSLVAGPERESRTTRFLAAFLVAAAGFFAYSLFWNDAFLLRLTSSEQTDYTSGRGVSIQHWLEMVEGHPFGLGPGAVRELLADGRPSLGGGSLLEWPHNEVVRFFVEGGVFGGLLILTLIGWVARRAVVAARVESDPLRRTLMLAVAADLVAQCLLQNYLNGVYQATVLLLLFAATAAGARGERPPASSPLLPVKRPGPLPQPTT